MALLQFIYEHKVQLAIELAALCLAYLLVRYRFKKPRQGLKRQSKEMIQQLIKEYKPKPIVDQPLAAEIRCEVLHNFANYDVFGLNSKNKLEPITKLMKKRVKEYGIGSCGPRAFYGTFDLHLQLENKIAKIYNQADAVLYSNHFTALQSVCACFCNKKNTVYFIKSAREEIIRGLSISNASTIVSNSLDELADKLDYNLENKFVILERVSKNTGEILDLNRVVKLRSEYGFRLILDESFSMPFLYRKPYDIELYSEVDIVVGSLAHGYPASGGFSCGSIEVIEYQRLNSTAYVFSASLPVFIAQAALCFIDTELDYEALSSKIKTAHQVIPNVISNPRMPILLVKNRNARELRSKIRKEGYAVGIAGEYLSVCISINVNDKDIIKLGEIINKIDRDMKHT